jgi:hypothetical protein
MQEAGFLLFGLERNNVISLSPAGKSKAFQKAIFLTAQPLVEIDQAI